MTWSGQASEHDADHGEADEGGDGAGIALEVARQATIAADPGEGSFDDPASGEDDKLVSVGALDDLDHPSTGAGDRLRGLRSLIASIGENALDEGEGATRLVQNVAHTVAILNVGGVDDDAQQEAERIDENVALAPRDLLARIETLRVKCGAPF
jgi:hypothetical protein